MVVTDVKISVPREMERFVVSSDPAMEMERNALLLYPYIKNLTISHGKAAEILGVDKFELIELYGNLGIPYYNMDIREVEDEVAAYRKLKGSKK